MNKRQYPTLAGAVLTTTPVIGRAATVSFFYESLGYTTNLSGNGVFTPLTPVFNGSNNTETVTIPNNSILSEAVSGSVTGSTIPAAVYSGWGSNAHNAAELPASRNLGLSAFAFGFNTSNASTLPWDYSGVSPFGAYGLPTINPNFEGGENGGMTNDPDNGNIKAASISGTNAGTGPAALTTDQFSYGANGAPADLFTGVYWDADAVGSVTVSPLNNATSPGQTYNQYFAYVSGGTTTSTRASSGPVFAMHNITSADTVNPLPALVVNIVNPIATLANTTGTGTKLGTISVIPSGGRGNYIPGSTSFTAATTGYVAVSGFNPLTDTEVYAIQLDYNNGSGEVALPPTSTLIATIVSDINAASFNVSASTMGSYSSLFPGYDVLLTSTGFTAGAGGLADLNIDFSQDTDSLTPGLTLTGVAAVPEPVSFSSAAIAAAVLLGRRRRNQTQINTVCHNHGHDIHRAPAGLQR